MKKMIYKGIEFDDFQLYREAIEEHISGELPECIHSGSKYEFVVTLCDGHMAKGTYAVMAKTEAEAQEKALTEICNKLYSALPELDIEVSVALVEDFKMENVR